MSPEDEVEEAECPVCGNLVSLSVASCPYCGAEFEESEEAAAAEVPEDEGAACPVCAKVVGLEVKSCPHCGAEFEEEEEAPQEAYEEEGVACPVCAKIVGLEVSSCPHCGAEFEEEEVLGEESSDEEGAACPVCGVVVSLEVASCPNCGAEFEEEAVEEIVEVEERRSPAKARAAEEGGMASIFSPTSIADPRVIGVALIMLGIVGSQIALLVDWYWTWVPPIEDNLIMFILIPVAILAVGLAIFAIMKKSVGSGRKIHDGMPRVFLSLFMFGILAVIVVLLWNPINSALQSSQVEVAAGFFLVIVVGVALMVMGSRMASQRATPA